MIEEKEFVPQEQALLLKQLGFREKCLENYSTNNHPTLQTGVLLGKNPLDPLMESKMLSLKSWYLPAPLYQQAFRWFREKYDLHLFVLYHTEGSNKFTNPHHFRIYNRKQKGKQIFNSIEYCSYEKAELECLKKLIEIVKNNKNGKSNSSNKYIRTQM